MSDNLSINNTNQINLSNLSTTRGSFVPNQDISALAEVLARKLGIPETVAFRVVRKFLTTGTVPNLKALEDYISKSGEFKVLAGKIKQPEQKRQNQNLIAKADDNNEAQVSLRPILKEIKVNLNRGQQAEIRNEVDKLFTKKEGLPQIDAAKIPVTKLVSSPQAFASWLVNNKAAFIALKSTPQAAYLLTAINNPILMQSPMMVSEISKLIAQLFKLKLGKQYSEALEDRVIEEREQELLAAAAHDRHSVVSDLGGTAETIEISAMKNFLLEAERFAEEEVANLWSLVLKKEREIGEKLKKGLKKNV